MATLLLVRHGETDWNRDHRWQGHTGPPLNELGRRQAHDLAGRLEAVDAIYSSDTIRARETAEIVGSRLGVPVRTDPRLREIDFGKWEGLTRQEIDARYGDTFARWEAQEAEPDGGESDTRMAERVIAALADICRRHGDERVLVVTSGGPIRAVQAHVDGVDQAAARRRIGIVRNCALVELVVRDGLLAPR